MSRRRCGLRMFIGVWACGALTACGIFPQPGLESLHRNAVLVEHVDGHGTGMIIGPNAVLTADHVVEGGIPDVTFFKGEARRGRIRWRDPALDLALLEVDVPARYHPPPLYCGDLQAGQHLILVGHPTHSRWVAVGGYLPTAEPFEGDLVPLGFPIGLGTSGGPVYDEGGRVVGVALAILAERASASAAFDDFKDTGIGLMLPAKEFCEVLVQR